MRLLKGGWAARRFQGPALPWGGLLLVLLAASAVGVELLVKELPANHSLYGDAKARWTINEYADLECPFCKVYTPRLKRWVDSHPDVNLVWRHLPLQMHGEAARHQARLVECAGIQGGAKAFWSAIDAIFAQSAGNGGGLAGGTLDFPELDQSRLEKCAKDMDEKHNIKLATFIATLFYDLSTQKQVRIPTQIEKRNRELYERVKKSKRSVALFVDEAHDPMAIP
ncbi:thioredoxin domain-containing protein [Pseudomonas aeruginosa]|uniref:DsbA family protein n=1 Tax=Pseudomonas aeruginosa TaxID=287 RepID=UPI0003197BAE|nr:thioredoxin domain-containing protein [Pseudomonas aeruginosa]MDI3944286.1 thioredoxin domain-containing protein [Pseudomonas aeruginosa]MDI3993646.1 thioredoxin domain-containing protein [Pseudomonas aeruginosa]